MATESLVRTYERGVEAETLSCGTGVTATAIAAMLKTRFRSFRNGRLIPVAACWLFMQVSIVAYFEDVVLEGPAQFVFEGEINL
jgi:diaminopimelate epimerase